MPDDFTYKKRQKEQPNATATDVGLEPTASALGGLRATIAPTGLDDLLKD